MKTALLSLFLVILLALSSAYLFEKNHQFALLTNHAIKKLNEKVDTSISTLEIRVANLEKNMASLPIKPNTSSSEQYSSDQGNMPSPENFSDPQRLKEIMAVNTAHQLTRLADIQLQMANVSNAILLLNEAKETLSSLDDDRTKTLKEELNHQTVKLASINMPNITEIWDSLNDLIQEVPTLPLRDNRIQNTKNGHNKNNEASKMEDNPQDNPQDNSKEKGWRQSLQDSMEDMKHLIKIQRNTKPLEPLLSNVEQQIAYENLTLLLEQARWAVLNRQQNIYQTSLKNAQQLLNEQFLKEDKTVQQVNTKLATLAKINLTPNLPNLKPLLTLFDKQALP